MFKYFMIVLIFLSSQVIASDAGHLEPPATSSKLKVQVLSKHEALVEVPENPGIKEEQPHKVKNEAIQNAINKLRKTFKESTDYKDFPLVCEAYEDEDGNRSYRSFILRLQQDEINAGKTIEDVLKTPGVQDRFDIAVPFDSDAVPQAYKFKVAEWVLKNKSEPYNLNGKNYVIEKLLPRQGSYGWVFLAKEAGTEEKRLIKILSTPSDREADMYEKLQGADGKGHLNFPKYYGVGKKWGYEWLIMEYIDGEILGQYLKSGKNLTDQLNQQIKDATRYMAECGVDTERENDQENILITNDYKRAVLIDFGTLAQR
ncbi:protein kinase family protein [Candidatus Finniella inopinata]|uniref:Protein kinase family protein n=1 Tax=Candidatus Finniella inopinata TaxID=1696036 RepID=A0A4Q7DHI2_9PROT|nr:protein kinase family protein [Candidatus Finniella inopinata]RZI46213.1 protein kinase family protein [Candidatus Finniella inopinata]